jgi:AcrR family transcriptional regulator
MARPRAEDYLEKQQLILDRAAILFARKGFAGTSIASIAESCNASKALIYHYYQSKESMLFDMLFSHCGLLVETAQEIMRQSDVQPEQKLRQLLRSFMAIYVSARAKHVVLLNDLHWLPEKQQKQIRELERKVIDIFKELVRAIRPDISDKTVTALAMSLMGSINWTYIWFKPEGALTPQKFADLTAGVFFEGVGSVIDGAADAGAKVMSVKSGGRLSSARKTQTAAKIARGG